MKKSFLILIAVVLALLAAAIAPLFKTDPGMVQIQFRGWTVETSVLVLILAILALWLLVWVILRIWKAPAETARRIRERRSLAQLEKGLLALTEGDWSTAERALEKSASAHGRTTARYLAAAEAADGQDAGDRAEWYLEQADTRNRKQKFLVDLTQLFRGQGRAGRAVETPSAPPAGAGNAGQVLPRAGRLGSADQAVAGHAEGPRDR
jgi:HemY protein